MTGPTCAPATLAADLAALSERAGAEFSAPCSACDRDKPCVPPAPTCPHPWYGGAA